MFTFMEWVRKADLIRSLFENYLTEAVRTGQPADFNQIAKHFVTAAQQIIGRDPTLPKHIKDAAAHIGSSSELQPSVLGGKLRGGLRGIDGNNQDDIIGNSFVTMVEKLPQYLHAKLGDRQDLDSDELASYLSGFFQRDAIQYKSKDFYRKSTRGPKSMSDVEGDSGNRLDPAYGDDKDQDTGHKIAPSLTPRSWNSAIRVLNKVREVCQKEGQRKAHEMKDLPRGKRMAMQTSAEKDTGRVYLIDTALALMNVMPTQMAELGIRTITGTQEANSGDEKVYKRVVSMAHDESSEINPEDRHLIQQWASAKSEYGRRQPKQAIAAALWVANGMVKSERPQLLSGGLADTFSDGDPSQPKAKPANWFFKIVHGFDPEELEDAPDDRPEIDSSEPEQEPSADAPFDDKPMTQHWSSDAVNEPDEKPHHERRPDVPKPRKNKRVRDTGPGLFDNM